MGFYLCRDLDVETLTSVIVDECRIAKAAIARRQSPIRLVQTETVEDEVVLKPRKDPSKIPIEDKINTASRANKVILSYDKRIKSCTISYLDSTGTNHFINSYRSIRGSRGKR
jgi:predicted Zn-dependent protease